MDPGAEKLYPLFGHDMTGAGIRDDGWIGDKGK
jgi:hypothetical protein